MKKIFQGLLGFIFIFVLFGCSSETTSVFTKPIDNEQWTVTYTYDKSKDVVSKIRLESSGSNEDASEKASIERLFKTVEGIDGVTSSVQDKDNKLVAFMEIDLKKCPVSKMKSSTGTFLQQVAASPYLKEDGDHVSFTKSKDSITSFGFTEKTK